jgi:hypothetical protein
MFFCCDVCRIQFLGLVERIKRDTGWDRIDGLEIAGDRRGRACVATSGPRSARFAFAFTPGGSLRRFARQDARSGEAPVPP